MKALKGSLVGVLLLAALTACGGGGSYATPRVYGEFGHCYYVQSPLEAIALQQAGYCPRNWIAYPMPGYWHDEYYSYYASPRYYNHYAPVQYRSQWKAQQKAYYAPRKSVIQKAQAAVSKVKQKITKTQPPPAVKVTHTDNPYTDPKTHKPPAAPPAPPKRKSILKRK